jgi:transposase
LGLRDMGTMRTTHDESIRKLAVGGLLAGVSADLVAAKLGVGRSTVYRWQRQVMRERDARLARERALREQEARVRELLAS